MQAAEAHDASIALSRDCIVRGTTLYLEEELADRNYHSERSEDIVLRYGRFIRWYHDRGTFYRKSGVIPRCPPVLRL